ncbi:MAG: hypothetical protein LBD62_00160 [Candidatus Margulisbacteria bacterium]|nr:hypothetical protein [Candidatus Margulisiibacteriota bacterium]
MRLHTYLTGTNPISGGRVIYHAQNVQHTPEPSTIEQKIEEFQKNCAEKYLPAIARIKKDFGWYLPENERNENDYQIAYQADWYEYALAQPLKDTLFLSLRNEEQKIQALITWERKIQDFIQSHYKTSADAGF